MPFLDIVADDLQTMLENETSGFAESVTIDTGAAAHTGSGVFDLTFQEVNVQTGQTVQSKTPRLSIYAPTWATALGEEITSTNAADWRVTVRGLDYTVKTVQPDGTGWVMLYLTRAKV
jgi:hypothetical protein